MEAAGGVLFACEEQATPFLTEGGQGMRQVVRGDAVTEQGYEGSFSSTLGLLRGSVQEPLRHCSHLLALAVSLPGCYNWEMLMGSQALGQRVICKDRQVFKIRSLMLMAISLGPETSFNGGYRIKLFCQLYLRFADG